MYDCKRAYSLLERISYERLAGSKEELEVANILKKEVEKEGVKAWLEEFPVDHAEIKLASLEVTKPFKKSYNVQGVMMSGNTADGGIEAPLVYIEDAEEANLVDIEGKIVLLNGRMFNRFYKKIIAKKPLGFISIDGSVYDDLNNSDLGLWAIRKKDYELGKIPGVIIRAIDAQELISSNPEKVKLVLKQTEGKAISHDVVCEIKGNVYPEQIIALTAHYDSVVYSSGAYDNGSGSVGIMELFHHFVKNPPKRTLRFIWCGAEEIGLEGSRAYVKAHEKEMANYVFCLNVDMIGVVLGKEIAVSTAEQTLVDYISYLGKEIGIAVKSSQGVYSSDSTPFADCGVPATSFARISSPAGAQIHTRKDQIDYLTAEAFDSSMKLMLEFITRMDNAVVFPIPRSIPDNMKLELDYYNMRKDRPVK